MLFEGRWINIHEFQLRYNHLMNRFPEVFSIKFHVKLFSEFNFVFSVIGHFCFLQKKIHHLFHVHKTFADRKTT